MSGEKWVYKLNLKQPLVHYNKSLLHLLDAKALGGLSWMEVCDWNTMQKVNGIKEMRSGFVLSAAVADPGIRGPIWIIDERRGARANFYTACLAMHTQIMCQHTNPRAANGVCIKSLFIEKAPPPPKSASVQAINTTLSVSCIYYSLNSCHLNDEFTSL